MPSPKTLEMRKRHKEELHLTTVVTKLGHPKPQRAVKIPPSSKYKNTGTLTDTLTKKLMRYQDKTKRTSKSGLSKGAFGQKK